MTRPQQRRWDPRKQDGTVSNTLPCELQFKLLKGGHIGNDIGEYYNYRVMKGDATRSLDYGLCSHDR